MKNLRNVTRQRTFSRADDEAIMAHVRGEFPARELERRLRATRPTLERRAEQLGITLRYIARKVGEGRRAPAPDNWDSAPDHSLTVGKDKLLSALYAHHAERAPEEGEYDGDSQEEV